MAIYQPTEEEIQNFMSVVPGIERSEVIARIKGNNNNVEHAINEYYENIGEDNNKYQWVDGQFSSDRDGGYMQQNTPSFNIHAPDDTGPYQVREPQTRPPTPSRSKINRSSPMSNVIDMTIEPEPGTSLTRDDDAELQQAIKASMLSAGLAPQQSGVTSTDTPAFGPATRSQYEENEWAMVTIGKSSLQETLIDPEPAARKRDLNVPAFLKPSFDEHRLGALLTIYHEIPLLREVFLNRLDILPNYGHDKEWWQGKPFDLPISINVEPDEDQELTYEIQRLMAFLDKTDRSYGSTEALVNLPAIKRMQRLLQRRGDAYDMETSVFRAWRKIFEKRETGQVSKLFSVGVENERRTEINEFAILDFDQPAKDSGIETFYEIADQALWPVLDSDIANCSYLEHVGDVITFRLREGHVPGENIDVPAVWYPDRYMKAGRQAALNMRQQKAEVNEELRRITELQEILTQVYVRNKMLKVKTLLRAALQHDQDKIQDERNVYPEQSFISEDEAMSKVSSDKAAKLSADLHKLVKSIDRKLLDLDVQKEKAKKTLRQISKLYTEPSLEPTEPPTHKYTLRGVSTTKNTTYVRRKAEIDLIDMGLEDDGSSPNGDQWWRIDYSSSGSNPVTVEKTTEEQVLEAAKTESRNIILVYASEKAMQFESKPLPYPLETFVRNDNQLFQDEIDAYENQRQAGHLASPSKRKFDPNSDSKETNQWDGGTSPKGYENFVQVTEKEVGSSNSPFELDIRTASHHLVNGVDESRTVTPGGDEPHELIHGVDPSLLSNDDAPFLGQEMQERNGMPMLSSRSKGEPANTIYSMDMDQVMEDENITEESAAVRHVELA